jgi:hypothetical protein
LSFCKDWRKTTVACFCSVVSDRTSSLATQFGSEAGFGSFSLATRVDPEVGLAFGSSSLATRFGSEGGFVL